MNTARQLPTPAPPKTCSPVEPPGSDWSLDTRLLMLLVMLAGFVFLLLLYRLFQLRHRLSLMSARNALEYHSCYRSATYTPKHSTSCDDKKRSVDQNVPTVQNDTAPLLPTSPVLPSPPLPPPPATPPLLALPLPVVHAPALSPHLSWRRSDVEIYSQVGAFRSSSQSRVIWFEHASL